MGRGPSWGFIISALGGWSIGVWFFFWSKGHNMSGNMALRTWIYSVLMRHLSCFLSYWSSHQLFKPRCWFLLVFCLARQSNLISWYSVFIHWFPDTLYLSMDYLHDCLHAHSVLTPGFPVTDWLRPRRGKRSASSSVRKSFNVQQFPSQVPKEKCLRYCSLHCLWSKCICWQLIFKHSAQQMQVACCFCATSYKQQTQDTYHCLFSHQRTQRIASCSVFRGATSWNKSMNKFAW